MRVRSVEGSDPGLNGTRHGLGDGICLGPNPRVRCRLSGVKYFGYPPYISEHARICHHNNHFAYDAQEVNIILHNLLLLAYFRYRYCLEVIRSEQCIEHVLKCNSKNSDSERISLQNMFYEGSSVTASDKLHYSVTSWISSALNTWLRFSDIGETTWNRQFRFLKFICWNRK
jgi:hypothetical protein